MSRVLFSLCSAVCFSVLSQQAAISSIELQFETYLGFTCGSKANVKSGFQIQRDTTYRINRAGSGKNSIVIDLVSMTFTNNALADGKTYHEQSKIEDVKIQNDTLSFYINAVSRISKTPYTEYFFIALKPAPNSIFSINLWKNPRYGNIGGTYLTDSYAKMKINYSDSN